MKVRYWGKNGKLAFLLSLFIAFLSVVFTWGFFDDSIKTHDSGWMAMRGNSYIAINYIDPKPIKTDVDGTNLYIAGYYLSDQLTNYFVLQADPNKDETKSLLVNADKLQQSPQRVFGSRNGSKPNPTIQEVVKEVSQSSDLDKEIRLYFEDDYFSITDLENQFQSLMIAVGVALLIYLVFAAAPNIYIFIHRRQAKRQAKEFFELYPELMGQIRSLESGASYVDRKAGVAIYRDHLVSFGQSFGFIDLRKAKKIVIANSTKYYSANPIALLVVFLSRSSSLVALGAKGKHKQTVEVNHRINKQDTSYDFVQGIQAYSDDIDISFQ